MMVEGRLINPRIVFSEAIKWSFDNTLVIYSDGEEVHRVELKLPYDMPDPDIEILVSQMVQDYAEQNYNQPVINPILVWDWPEWDMVNYGAA